MSKEYTDQCYDYVKEVFCMWATDPQTPIIFDGYYQDEAGEEIGPVTVTHSPEWLCLELWNCQEIMPVAVWDLSLHYGHTYAEAARLLRPMAPTRFA